MNEVNNNMNKNQYNDSNNLKNDVNSNGFNYVNNTINMGESGSVQSRLNNNSYVNGINNNVQDNSMLNDNQNGQLEIGSRMDKYNLNNLDNTMDTNIVTNNQLNNMDDTVASNLINNNNNNNVVLNSSISYKDDTDAYFADVKRRGFPIWIIFLILLLVVTGGGIYYFIVIDTPQNIFRGILNSKLFDIKLDDYDKLTVDFDVSGRLVSSDEDMKKVFDIINKMSIKGSIGEDYKDKLFFFNLESMYESKGLLSISSYYEDENIYLESNDIYDKVLKYEVPEEMMDMINELFENDNKEEVNKILLSVKNALSNTLMNVKNSKEYVKLDNKYVKKVSIFITPQTVADVLKKLVNDKDFLSNCVKLTGKTELDLKEALEDEISLYEKYEKDGGYESVEISLYLSSLTNIFYKFEVVCEDIMMSVVKDGSVFSYKLYDEDDIVQVEGDFSLVKNNNDYSLLYSIDIIEEQISMEFNIDYSLKYDEEIQKISTIGAVDINDLSEQDLNDIMTRITENNNIKKFIDDVNFIYSYMQEYENFDYMV